MQIVVLAGVLQKEELLRSQMTANVVWINTVQEFSQHRNADAFVDLKFVNTIERQQVLQQLLPKPVIVNSVVHTLSETHASFIRINGWNTFLSSSIIEAACNNNGLKTKAEAVFALWNKELQWLPDEAGFVTPRVVSTIVNEAFLALAEGVSTKDEINTAMKLGTAYPYGPFEWAEKIGVRNIVALLEKLSATQEHYTPAELLMKEALID
ncbi:3-hydroxyacyl-CoA dehydrogenase family protein [Flavisolibacter ginsenosidimutans]|uniref:3-hydroxyacyl-CoA dehydrogenase C-terminal domain-containing protein n=1 Tax=Flavisolibacter ginsenosidimutans TaxID=661481 RepID=A0A5B8UMC9_9BACT|nr:3-hydroxyacyl-CoA dehydrogenase family protein [Flavisolibacter ginsenosidimutans]QEC57827.1 hypothetical protein FSB75_18600 [Flavisolibacter ginsenosidimutans]